MNDIAAVAESLSLVPMPRRERTRMRICVAAQELFLRKGFNNTTMEEIAITAQLQRSTVYNHFRDKEEILNVIAQDYLAQVSEVIRKLPSPSPTRAEIDLWIKDLADFATNTSVPTLLIVYSSLNFDGMGILEELGESILRVYGERVPAFRKAFEGEDYLAKARSTAVLRELSWALSHHVEDDGGRLSAAMLQVAGDMLEDLVKRQ